MTYALGVFGFGRAVLSIYWCAVFPRSARKNRTQMIVVYHAAAGNMVFKCGLPRNLYDMYE